MLKGLNTLIKLHKRQLDILRRSLGELEQKREAFVMLSQKLHEELINEIALSEEYASMRNFFGNYAQRIDKQQQQIAEEIKRVDADIARVQDQISEQFGEMKKFEITREAILKRQREEAARKENILMDEIGMQQYTRQDTNYDQ